MAGKQVNSKNKTPAKRKAKTKPTQELSPRSGEKLKHFFLQTALGRFSLASLLFVAVFFLNLLISADHLASFSLLWGIEILILILVGWGVFLYRRYQEREEED